VLLEHTRLSPTNMTQIGDPLDELCGAVAKRSPTYFGGFPTEDAKEDLLHARATGQQQLKWCGARARRSMQLWLRADVYLGCV
jgi:hypothetical protein